MMRKEGRKELGGKTRVGEVSNRSRIYTGRYWFGLEAAADYS